MSFLIDAPWLAANGYLIAKVSPNEKVERALELAIDAAFLSVSVPMYLNAKWTEPVWNPTGSESGRDWMINSRVFTFEHERPSWKTHAVSAVIFATYPLWLKLGLKMGSRNRRT
jgi:hypothetical protein